MPLLSEKWGMLPMTLLSSALSNGRSGIHPGDFSCPIQPNEWRIDREAPPDPFLLILYCPALADCRFIFLDADNTLYASMLLNVGIFNSIFGPSSFCPIYADPAGPPVIFHPDFLRNLKYLPVRRIRDREDNLVYKYTNFILNGLIKLDKIKVNISSAFRMDTASGTKHPHTSIVACRKKGV